MENRLKTTRLSFIILLFFLSLYILLCRGEFYAMDEMGRYGLTKTIVIEGDLTVTRPNGTSFYVPWPILQSVLAVPAFTVGQFLTDGGILAKEAGGRLLVSFFNSLVGALSCVVFFHICLHLKFRIRSSLIMTLVFGLCTILLPYSRTFLSEPLTGLLLLAAVLAALSSTREKPLWGILCGAFLALAAANNYVASLVFGICFIYFLSQAGALRDIMRFRTLRDTRLWALGVFGAAALAWLLWYNHLRYGSFLQGRLSYWTTAANPVYPEGLSGFSYPLFAGIYGFLFSPVDSIFLFSPPLIGALVAWPRFVRENRRTALFFLAIPLVYLLVNAKFADWWGGFAWGPRFLVPITGFALIPFGYFIDDFHKLRHSAKLSIVALCFGGFYVQLLATVIHPVRGYVDMLERLGGEYYELMMHHLPQACPIVLHSRLLGTITSPADTDLYFLKHLDSGKVILVMAMALAVFIVALTLYLRAMKREGQC